MCVCVCVCEFGKLIQCHVADSLELKFQRLISFAAGDRGGRACMCVLVHVCGCASPHTCDRHLISTTHH